MTPSIPSGLYTNWLPAAWSSTWAQPSAASIIQHTDDGGQAAYAARHTLPICLCGQLRPKATDGRCGPPLTPDPLQPLCQPNPNHHGLAHPGRLSSSTSTVPARGPRSQTRLMRMPGVSATCARPNPHRCRYSIKYCA